VSSRSFSSKIPGFYKLSRAERIARVAEFCDLSEQESQSLSNHPGGLTFELAEAMVENVLGVLGLPLGVGLNFLINQRDYLIPMAVEEPSVIAAVSFAAKLTREGGGVAQIAEGVVQASRFAQADPYRAATHNKGIMNGIDAVAIATGNDWRAIEAGAHAFAARSGRYWTMRQ
jgi:hydroxymethylglutaryl-CoA reductase